MKLYKFYIGDLSQKELGYWYGLMTPEKKRRVDGFWFEDDKKRTVAGEMLAKKAISQLLSQQADSIVILSDDKGKPYAKDLDIHFSISHCADLVVCAVSKNLIGVDVEKINEDKLSVAGRVCTEAELRYIYSSEHPAQSFFEVWTAKEAYIKCKGTGFSDILIDTTKLSFYREREGDYIISVFQKGREYE